MTWMLALLLCQQPPSPLPSPSAPQPTSKADQIRATMAASIEKQLASVRLQSQTFGVILTPPSVDTPEGKALLAAMAVHLISLAQ